MVLLVTSDNLLLFFLSWEGVGVCSYILINFWYSRVQANKAALKALFINRIGDIFLIVGVSLIFNLYGTLDFTILNALTHYKVHGSIQTVFIGYRVDALTLIGGCFIIGAVGKSAQIGLHTWLPDAMEGPTPVSALLHAATMVTAGIFLLLKCAFLFEFNLILKSILIFFGLITAFFAASVACAQTDLKKVIAYSTCSQLGYMVFTVGFSQYQLSVFHLFNHAFFKALLFISAGIIIHNFYDEQDIRKIGNLQIILPSIYIINLIATLAITGFPFLSGFYSKDVIIETAYNIVFINNSAIYWIVILTAVLTTFYSFKILFIIFYSTITSLKSTVEKFHPISNFLFLPVVILSIFSCFSGFIAKELFSGIGNNVFLFPILPEYGDVMLMNEFLSFNIKITPFIFSICSIFFASYYYCNARFNLLSYMIQIRLQIGFFIINFFNQKWYIDNIINRVGYYFFKISYVTAYKLVDKNIIEYCVVNVLSQYLVKISYFLSSFNTGLITHHISLTCLTLLFFTGLLITF
jgi:proton-translocating NADH-quinone oxidoreductase chain L